MLLSWTCLYVILGVELTQECKSDSNKPVFTWETSHRREFHSGVTSWYLVYILTRWIAQYFQVAACLSFKVSPGAQPFKWKWVAYSYGNQTHFPYNSCAPRLTSKPRQTATRKWPNRIVFTRRDTTYRKNTSVNPNCKYGVYQEKHFTCPANRYYGAYLLSKFNFSLVLQAWHSPFKLNVHFIHFDIRLNASAFVFQGGHSFYTNSILFSNIEIVFT